MIEYVKQEDHITGSTYGGCTFNITVNGAAIDLSTATEIQIDYQGLANPRRFYQLTLTGGQIEKVGTYVFRIKAQVISFVPDSYRGTIRITYSGGTIFGKIKTDWQIIPNNSQNG